MGWVISLLMTILKSPATLISLIKAIYDLFKKGPKT